MTTARKPDVDKILKALQEAMLLRDWKPWIDHDAPAPPGICAQVFRRDDFFDARIRISDTLRERSAWHVHQTLAHELLHLVLRDCNEAFERLAYSDFIPKAMRDDLIAAWRHEEEKVVDQLGRVIANLMVDDDEPDDHFPGFRDEDR